MKTPAEMTKDELNRAMIWLYPPKLNITYSDQSGEPKYYVERKWQLERIDYLSDWNLTMPLAYKENLMVSFSPDCTYAEYDEVLDDMGNEILFNAELKGGRPLRTICEVLVQIGIEKLK